MTGREDEDDLFLNNLANEPFLLNAGGVATSATRSVERFVVDEGVPGAVAPSLKVEYALIKSDEATSAATP